MDRTVIKNATCTGCGCLCDDIELHTERQRIVSAERACDRGRDLFLDHGRDDALPSALIDGRPAPMDEAIEVAAEILMSADMPLVYGLSNSTSESQQAAIMLAEEIGAVVDSHTSLTHGPALVGAQLVGKVTCTLGEVKNRADLIVYWGTNPVATHPRHLSKFTLDPEGTFVPGGRSDRTMVLIDVRETSSALAADRFVQIRPGTDFELLTALRALVDAHPIEQGLVEATGLTLQQLTDLVDVMKNARFGVFFFGPGLTMTRGGHMNVAALFALTASLNAVTKFAAMPMRAHGNDAGADSVMSWQTGYQFGVDFTRGFPRANPGEFTAVDLLVRREADAALILAADPWMTMPQPAVDHLNRIPVVVIDRRTMPPRGTARVHFTTAAPGISTPGTAYRMDKVPLTMRPAVHSPHSTDEDVLRGIYGAVSRRQDHAVHTRSSPLPGTLASPV